MKIKKTILITGSHASGSTFTGKMISLNNEIAYLHEPFNIVHTPGIWKPELQYWFTYICKENEKDYEKAIKDYIDLKIHFSDEIKECKKVRDFLRLTKYAMIKKQNKILNKRVLLKDPIAIMSTEWLANTFNMDVVILIRHPISFVGSLKNNNWKHPFEHFLEQPLLMQNYLDKFREQIELFAKEEQTIVEQGILLWNIIYTVVLKYYEKHQDDWLFIKHEDLAVDPINSFQMIYEKLELNFDSKISNKIYEYTHTKNSRDNLKRNSKDIIYSWKKRLTEEEIVNITEKTLEIASKFYPNSAFLHDK